MEKLTDLPINLKITIREPEGNLSYDEAYILTRDNEDEQSDDETDDQSIESEIDSNESKVIITISYTQTNFLKILSPNPGSGQYGLMGLRLG